MKFFTAILLVALVAVTYAAENQARKLEPAKEIEPSAEADQVAVRGRRGLIHGTFAAPLTGAVEVAAPVAYTYSANLPYAYSAYRAYAPYYTHPAIYI